MGDRYIFCIDDFVIFVEVMLKHFFLAVSKNSMVYVSCLSQCIVNFEGLLIFYAVQSKIRYRRKRLKGME